MALLTEAVRDQTAGVERWSRVDDSPAAATIARFTGASGAAEVHVAIRPKSGGPIEAQLAAVHAAYRQILADAGLTPDSAVFRRYFCSDLANQVAALEAQPLSARSHGRACAISWVGQAPPPPYKVALWAWHVVDPQNSPERRGHRRQLSLRRGSLTHHWSTGLTAPDAPTSEAQTRAVLERYERDLAPAGWTVPDHLVRTWFFVQHIDRNYEGLVTARREFFARHGLLPETHYVASTGIEGGSPDAAALVTLDAYAIGGLRPEQVTYLQALDHLSPTHLYGVTFERGTAIDYRDRRQVIISGTASIDSSGRIAHPGDVQRQLGRTLENVEALLRNAGAGLRDVLAMIVYVRDPADHATAWQQLIEHCGQMPTVLVTAPVCRPGWLIEVECLAAIGAHHPELPEW